MCFHPTILAALYPLISDPELESRPSVVIATAPEGFCIGTADWICNSDEVCLKAPTFDEALILAQGLQHDLEEYEIHRRIMEQAFLLQHHSKMGWSEGVSRCKALISRLKEFHLSGDLDSLVW